MSITQTIRQEMTVNQSQLDTVNTGFTTNGTAETLLSQLLWGS